MLIRLLPKPMCKPLGVDLAGSLPMDKTEAHRILDKVKAGLSVPLYVINAALHATGDL